MLSELEADARNFEGIYDAPVDSDCVVRGVVGKLEVAVQISVGDVGPGEGKVQARGYSQSSLVHAADHGRGCGGPGYCIYFGGPVQSAALGKLNVVGIRSAGPFDGRGVRRAEYSFVCHYLQVVAAGRGDDGQGSGCLAGYP